jgi:hypothetical protein
MREILGVLAGLLFIAGFLPYIRAILRKETKPAKVTWIIWMTIDVIGATGMYAAGTLNYQMIGATAGASIVVVLAMKYGTPGWTMVDRFCLGGAALGIVLWQLFNNPVLGIVTSAVVGFIGSIPTFAAAWHKPENENKTAWTIYWISCVCAVVAIPHWTPADAVQPIMFFMVESIMMFILFVRIPDVQPEVHEIR